MPAAQRHNPARAFTLIEAVLALVILATVLAVCLQIRVQGLRQQAAVARMQQQDQAIEALFQQVVHNLLPGGVPTESGARHWEGEHLGRPFTVDKQPTVMDNPARAVAVSNAAPTVRLFQYTITWNDHTTTFYWHQ